MNEVSEIDKQVLSDTEESADELPAGDKPDEEDSDVSEELKVKFQHAAEELKQEKYVKCGYLKKKGEHRRNWKKRWFVLFPSRICYYKNDKVFNNN